MEDLQKKLQTEVEVYKQIQRGNLHSFRYFFFS